MRRLNSTWEYDVKRYLPRGRMGNYMPLCLRTPMPAARDGLDSRSGRKGAEVQILSDSPSLASGLTCGIDIEMVDNLPVVPDYWEDKLFTTTFTTSEIAYCLLQANPPMHFAARWCAKEALKKCDISVLAGSLRQAGKLQYRRRDNFYSNLLPHGTWGNISSRWRTDPVPYSTYGSGCGR